MNVYATNTPELGYELQGSYDTLAQTQRNHPEYSHWWTDAGADERDEGGQQQPAQSAFGRGIGHRPQEMAASRPAECPRLQGEAPFLDVGERGDDDRPHDRQQATQSSPEAALRVQAAGPLTLADFIGLDVCLNILEVLQRGYGDPKYRPCPLLRQMVDAGKLGRKSGQGFYTCLLYTSPSPRD